jgi:hypothetical protein
MALCVYCSSDTLTCAGTLLQCSVSVLIAAQLITRMHVSEVNRIVAIPYVSTTLQARQNARMLHTLVVVL